MRFSEADSVKVFFSTYDGISADDRKRIPIEAVALAAQVNFSEFLGDILLAFREFQTRKSGMIALGAHPGLVGKSIKMGMKDQGFSDRKLLHEAVGFLPTSKGTSINFNMAHNLVNQQMNNPPVPDEVEETQSPEVNEVFPMIHLMQQDWQQNRDKKLNP